GPEARPWSAVVLDAALSWAAVIQDAQGAGSFCRRSLLALDLDSLCRIRLSLLDELGPRRRVDERIGLSGLALVQELGTLQDSAIGVTIGTAGPAVDHHQDLDALELRQPVRRHHGGEPASRSAATLP